jgi:site-specific DNA recombinase
MYVYHKAPVFYCKNCKNKIAVSDIEEIYQEQLKSFLLSDSDLQSFHNKSNSILTEKGTLLEHLQSESKKVKKKMDDLLTLRLEGDMSKDLFPIHYKPLEERYLQIEDQIPEIEAEIDFLKIQQLSSDTVQSDAKNLFDQWENLPFEEKRTIVETLTDHITVDKEDIAIKLSYIPILPIVIGGKAQRNRMDS